MTSKLTINIRTIRINSISTLGSLNVGKAMFADNHSNSVQHQHAGYQSKTEPPTQPEALKEEAAVNDGFAGLA